MRTSLFFAFAVTAAVVVAAVEGVASTGAVCTSGFEIRGECVPVGVSACKHSTRNLTCWLSRDVVLVEQSSKGNEFAASTCRVGVCFHHLCKQCQQMCTAFALDHL
jgi:hypothetical protein